MKRYKILLEFTKASEPKSKRISIETSNFELMDRLYLSFLGIVQLDYKKNKSLAIIGELMKKYEYDCNCITIWKDGVLYRHYGDTPSGVAVRSSDLACNYCIYGIYRLKMHNLPISGHLACSSCVDCQRIDKKIDMSSDVIIQL